MKFNTDVVFVDCSGQVRTTKCGDLTLRANDQGTGHIIVGSGLTLRPEADCQSLEPIDLGLDYLRWNTLFACSGNFHNRPTVNGSGVLLEGEAASSAAVALNNGIFVAKNGNDTTGDGAVSTPFLTIRAAINRANQLGVSQFNPYAILVAPGAYFESNPLPLPPGLDLVNMGSNFSTSIFTTDHSNPLILCSGGVSTKGFNLFGPQSAPAAIAVSGTEGQFLSVDTVIQGSASGVYLTNGASGIIMSTSFTRNTVDIVTDDSSCSLIIGGGSRVERERKLYYHQGLVMTWGCFSPSKAEMQQQ